MVVSTVIQCWQRVAFRKVGMGGFCNSVVQTCRNDFALKRCFQTSAVALRKLDTRAFPPSKEPSSRTKRWEPRKKMKDLYEYTVKPLPLPNTGGRGPNGRTWNHKRGGGNKKNFRMIDWVRGGPVDGPPHVERVTKICYDPYRTANIAMVAAGTKRRYIIATQNMKVGDLISSSQKLSATAVRVGEGDSYPLGSLSVGTLINSVQKHPDSDARLITAAGTSGQIVRKLENSVVIRLPSKDEITVLAQCTATVGRVSNVDHSKVKVGKAGRNRWRGFRPKSGLWHRKTGRFGRKIKAPSKTRVYEEKPRGGKVEKVKLTYNG